MIENEGCERQILGICVVLLILMGIAFLASLSSDKEPIMTPAGMLLGGLIC